jgi:hypothetical protein
MEAKPMDRAELQQPLNLQNFSVANVTTAPTPLSVQFKRTCSVAIEQGPTRWFRWTIVVRDQLRTELCGMNSSLAG